MNHYGKLAVTAFRVMAVMVFFWGFLGVVWSMPVWLGQVESQTTAPTNLMSAILWIIGGAALYALSGTLAEVITRKLGD